MTGKVFEKKDVSSREKKKDLMKFYVRPPHSLLFRIFNIILFALIIKTKQNKKLCCKNPLEQLQLFPSIDTCRM